MFIADYDDDPQAPPPLFYVSCCKVQEDRHGGGHPGWDYEGSSCQLELLHRDKGIVLQILAYLCQFCVFLFAVSCILVQDVSAQDEAERLAETVRATFSLEKLPESFHLDETDFVHGLPKVSRSFSIFPTYSKLLMNQTLNTMFPKSFFRNSHRTTMDDHSLILQRFCFASSTWLNRSWPNLQDHLTWLTGKVFITFIQPLPLISWKTPWKQDRTTKAAAKSIDSWSLQSPSWSKQPLVTKMMCTTLGNLFAALNLQNYSTSSLPWLSLQGGTIMLILINSYTLKVLNRRFGGIW